MADIPVKIGSARHREAVLRRKCAVTIFGRSIVIAVAHFERLQSAGGKPRNQMVHRGQTGMRHRDEAPSLANDSKDRFGRRSAPRHERGLAGAEQPLERIIPIARMSRAHERIRYLWPADRPPRSDEHDGRERLEVDNISEVRQPGADLSNTLDALSALPVKKCCQRRMLRIHEIGQHVNIAAILDGCDLDTAYEPNSSSVRFSIRLRDPCARVVIGHTDDSETARRRARDENRGLQQPIRRSRVQMEIDQDRASG